MQIVPKPGDDSVDERRPLLADLVEMQAARQGRMTLSNLAGWIRKVSAVASIRSETFLRDDMDDAATDGTEEGPRDRAEEAAALVFEQLNERSLCLGGKYPFAVSSNVDELTRLDAVEGAAYRSLLGLSVAHRHRLGLPIDVKLTFERMVLECLPRLGFAVSHLGTAGPATGNIVQKILSAAQHLGLSEQLRPNLGLLRARAQDAGVDVLARLCGGDRRSGGWVLFAQATVARSEEWDRKAGEATTTSLREVFSDHIPLAALAVPYHVDTKRLREISKRHHIVVLDRLRLASLSPAPIDELDHVLTAAEVCWS